jgi:hypothetical protein
MTWDPSRVENASVLIHGKWVAVSRAMNRKSLVAQFSPNACDYVEINGGTIKLEIDTAIDRWMDNKSNIQSYLAKGLCKNDCIIEPCIIELSS